MKSIGALVWSCIAGVFLFNDEYAILQPEEPVIEDDDDEDEEDDDDDKDEDDVEGTCTFCMI